MKYQQFLIADGFWVVGVNTDGRHILTTIDASLQESYLPAARPPLALPGDRIYNRRDRKFANVIGVYSWKGDYIYRIPHDLDILESLIVTMCT